MISPALGSNQFVLYPPKMFLSVAQRQLQIPSLLIRMREKKHGTTPLGIRLGIRHLTIFFTSLVELRPVFSGFRLWNPTMTATKMFFCNALNVTVPVLPKMTLG